MNARFSHPRGKPAAGTAIRVYMLLGILIVAGVFLPAKVSATALSLGFDGDDTVLSGMIVSISQQNTDTVERAHSNNAEYVVGIAVEKDVSTVVLDENNNYFVATEGTTSVYVSTAGGDIAAGDLIVVSDVAGVGMKQTPNLATQKIVGVAKSDFSATSPNARTFSLENTGDVVLGSIQMEMLLSEPFSAVAAGGGENILVRIGQRIAGKPVSLTQVLMTAAVIIAGFLVSGAILFGAIKGSFMSIGRNPLSAKVIYGGMVRTSLISLGVMALGVSGGYVLLIV